MTISKLLCSQGRRLSLVAFCLLSARPLLSAQTGKGLTADACYNEVHQRDQNALWASRLQRHTAGHVYLEEEIETVDGPIHRLISVDGHEPSHSEGKQEDARLHDVAQNPKARLALKKDRDADERKVDDRLIPQAFLFDDQGNQGGLERVAFRPNPAYAPKTYEERALHAMSGIILVDPKQKRLAQFSATLVQKVDFGYGAVGSLNQGGTINVTRLQVSPGIWKTSSSRIDINGRVAFFKTISKQQDEVHSDFKPVASDTNIARALQQLGGK
ncbi:MAG: hypothetical protein QOJ51_5258 [Acidobacteriaceae bacterium]|jgi:hypothetical protein|nr:hypothetical protein [Acidobacteriaceae bacterium]